MNYWKVESELEGRFKLAWFEYMRCWLLIMYRINDHLNELMVTLQSARVHENRGFLAKLDKRPKIRK